MHLQLLVIQQLGLLAKVQLQAGLQLGRLLQHGQPVLQLQQRGRQHGIQQQPGRHLGQLFSQR